MAREVLLQEVQFRLWVCVSLQHELRRRASLLADAQRQLAIGRDSDVVLALLGEHEPLLAQELREITNA
jgi:hypothetical protein